MKTILFLIILAFMPAGAEETVSVEFSNRAFVLKGGKKTLLKKGDRISLDSQVNVDKEGGLGLGYERKTYNVYGGTVSSVREVIKEDGQKLSKPAVPGGVRGVEEEKERLTEEKQKLQKDRVKRNSPKAEK